MLKLSLRPGEFINIGDNVRVVFSGGSSNNIHLLIDAPREVNIVRSKAIKEKRDDRTYYSEKKISKDAQKQIERILMEEKNKNLKR